MELPSSRRAVLKYTMSLRWLRWVLLALYLGLVLGLGGIAFFGAGEVFAVVVLIFTFATQALFLLGSGKLELSRPVRGWRLIIPMAVAALMLAILIGGAGLALSELFYLDGEWVSRALLAMVVASWFVWGFLLFVYCQGRERFSIIARLTGLIFAGSLASLLVSIPAHIIVSRRPGCFVGIVTFFGIASGVYVMLWSFGPAILLLFMKEKRRFELRDARRQADITTPAIVEQRDIPEQ